MAVVYLAWPSDIVSNTKDLVRRLFKAFNDGDLATLNEITGEDHFSEPES